MDDLPRHLVLEILDRLSDSFDLARCRVSSRTLNSLSYDVKSVNLQCSFDRYLRSRASPETMSSVTPFKSVFKSLILRLSCLESVSIGVEKPLRGMHYDEFEDESDDLHLTDVAFVSEWIPWISDRVKSLCFSDFWVQSCWRRSDLLALISRHCSALVELEVKNAWLSVDGLNPMSSLTKLTLEFIRLDDEDLTKLNKCFPFLQVLNLVGVGGLKEPKINLQHLTTCEWTVSNAPFSLSIIAPKLVDLKLKCVRPKLLILDTPVLSEFHLAVEEVWELRVVNELCGLKIFKLESSNVGSLICRLRFGKTVKSLSLYSSFTPKQTDGGEDRLTLDRLFKLFPNLTSLVIGPGLYAELEASYEMGVKRVAGMMGLKDLMVYLVINDSEEASLSFILCILEGCPDLSSVALLIHQELDSMVASKFITRCVALSCSRYRWKWGLWKEGNKDIWVSDGI